METAHESSTASLVRPSSAALTDSHVARRVVRSAAGTQLRGRATASASAQFAARATRRPASSYMPLCGTASDGAPVVSDVGIGTYLGECDDAEDARYVAALGRAFGLGANLVDTAINYRCQRAERVVGEALRAAIASGAADRAAVTLCTKGGYIALDGAPPATKDEYRRHLELEYYGPGVMTPADVVAGGHSLAPGFLAHQLARSRANLGVECVDLYYLHNPEQQLDAADAVDLATLHDRLRLAFAWLETQVEAGTIARYGVATWQGLRVAPTARAHLSLSALVEIAREVAGDSHHFAAVQLPVSLAMPEAARAPTQPLPAARVGPLASASMRFVPALEAAVELGVAVIASAPLMQGQLAAGLPDAVRAAFPGCRTDAQRALAFTRALPGVRSALVGMRNRAHVEENVAEESDAA